METQQGAPVAHPPAASSGAPTPGDERLIRIEEVERLTGLKKSAVYAGMAQGAFPSNVLIGSRNVAWKLSEVRRWIAERPTVKRAVNA